MSELCHESQALRRLQSVTLTVETRQAKPEHSWTQGVVALLASSPLEFFHVSSLGGELHAGGLDDQFCADIVAAHGARLRRFSVHRLRMGPATVRDVCARCPRLEQLFVVLDRSDLVSPARVALSRLMLMRRVVRTTLRRVSRWRRVSARCMSIGPWAPTPMWMRCPSCRGAKF